jgi:hypothetical protein
MSGVHGQAALYNGATLRAKQTIKISGGFILV